jgi:hypothetical protein
MKRAMLIFTAACFLMLFRSGLADSILVGTSLTNLTAGAGLCFNDADCENLRQQFTFTSPVVIDQIKIIMEPGRINGPGYGGGDFTVLFFASPTSNFLGSGEVPPNSTGDIVPQEFDFAVPDILVNPGTYYLEATGGNVAWAHAQPLLTTAGTMGQEQYCDPTVGCRWQSVGGTLAMEIDGTVVTPELSSWLLLGTGVLAACGITRRKLRH